MSQGNSRRIDDRDIPDLEPHCVSWVVIRNNDGKCIGEFFTRLSLSVFNANQVTVKTTAQYLASLNV